MADATPTKNTYPYVSANVWAELKGRFQKSVPPKVTPSYLQSALGFASEKAAKNLMPQLRQLGLIDIENVPTELAQQFRMDSDYAEAATAIVQKTYPGELRDLYPGPEEDIGAVTNWFMRDTGGGQGSAAIQARFYLLLASGKLPATDRPAKVAVKAATPVRSAISTVKKAPIAKPAEAEAAEAQGAGTAITPPSRQPALPGLHVDIQIHIDSSASAEQIDAVFASMAKHIYARR
jgi:Family of unknown function (DUF5343)